MAAPVSADGRVGAAAAALPGLRMEGFEVMPDGRRFVTVATSGTRPGLVLILNGKQLLARYAPD